MGKRVSDVIVAWVKGLVTSLCLVWGNNKQYRGIEGNRSFFFFFFFCHSSVGKKVSDVIVALIKRVSNVIVAWVKRFSDVIVALVKMVSDVIVVWVKGLVTS